MGLHLGDIVRLGAAEVYYVVRGIAPSTAETVLTKPSAAFLGTYVYLPLEDLALAGEAPLPDEIFVKVPLGTRALDGFAPGAPIQLEFAPEHLRVFA